MPRLALALPLCLLVTAHAAAQNPIVRLEVRVTTGNDDLREGSQLYVTWQLAGQAIQRQSIIRRRERLADRTTNVAQVNFPSPVRLQQITEVGLDFVADKRDMMGDDEWVLDRLTIAAFDARGQRVATLVDQRLNKKFAHHATWRSGPLAFAQPEEVAFTGFEVTVETGDDDFHKESGLALEIELTTGNAPIRLPISPGRRLADRTTWTTRAMLTPRDTPGGRVLRRNVHRVLLQYSADRNLHTLVSEVDQWELRGVSVRGIAPDGHLVPLASSGAMRQKLEGSDYWVSRSLAPVGVSEIIQHLPATSLKFVIFTGNDDLRSDSTFRLYLVIGGREVEVAMAGHNMRDEVNGTYNALFKDRTAVAVVLAGGPPSGFSTRSTFGGDPRLSGRVARYQVRDVERVRIAFTPGDAVDDVGRALVDEDHNNVGMAQDQWEMLWVEVLAYEPRTGTTVFLTRDFQKVKFNTNLRTWQSDVLPSFSTAMEGYGRAGTPGP